MLWHYLGTLLEYQIVVFPAFPIWNLGEPNLSKKPKDSEIGRRRSRLHAKEHKRKERRRFKNLWRRVPFS
jgi:hypothetical protein